MSDYMDFPDLVDPESGRRLLETVGGLSSGERLYEVVAGIPRLLISDGSGYVAAFGQQWNRWSRTQLDSNTGLPISRDRLLRCLGDELTEELSEPGRCMDVLEAGCGAGRFTEILLSMPAVRLTSMDLSSAVEANQRNFPQNARHRIVQGDINKPPFEPESFDLVVCLGVIQHTPDTKRAITSLYSLVRPGGWLVLDHYILNYKQLTRVSASGLRPLVKRLPSATRSRVCERVTEALLPMHRAARRSRLATKALTRVSPVVTYYEAIPELGDDLQREWALLDTHDFLTAWFSRLRTPTQIRRVFEGLGAISISSNEGGNGVEARCRRP